MKQRGWLATGLVVLGLLAGWLLTGGGGEAGRTPETPAVGHARISAPAAPAPTLTEATTEPARGPTRTTVLNRGGAVDPESGLPWVDTADLPVEARETLTLIDRGGPFPYDKDGATFGNLEGLLPQQRRGYYREYTVETPGSRDRGARRIVTGNDDRIFYWTNDHYASFGRIRR